MNPLVFFFANLDATGEVSVLLKVLSILFFVFIMITTIGIVTIFISDNG